jgi:hypothetical protein
VTPAIGARTVGAVISRPKKIISITPSVFPPTAQAEGRGEGSRSFCLHCLLSYHIFSKKAIKRNLEFPQNDAQFWNRLCIVLRKLKEEKKIENNYGICYTK